MTCHHRNPLQHEGVHYTPDQVIGDAKRCRCGWRALGMDHCHHTANGEDMLCVFCRIICKVEAGLKFAIKPEIDLGQMPYCRLCADNRAARADQSA